MSTSTVPSFGVSKYQNFVPKDYGELFSHYYPMIRTLVCRAGIESQNVEDVSMAILTKFIEHDALADYDPQFTSHHGGVLRKSFFPSFLSSFVLLYVRYHRERQTTRHRREYLVLDEGTPRSESLTPSCTDSYDQLYDQDLIREFRGYLASYTNGLAPLALVFDEIIKHLDLFGQPDIPVLAVTFGCSEQTIRIRMRVMRRLLHTALES